ncbi:hypothetical protein Q5752_005895 [Cryptotrichosporon argae]
MSPAAGPSTPPPAHWLTVSPLTRPLALSIVELNPVSITLAFTPAPPVSTFAHSGSAGGIHSPVPARRRRKGVRRTDQTDDEDDEHDLGTGGSASPAPHLTLGGAHASAAGPTSLPAVDGSSFKDMLSQGVVVFVNGVRWTRIVAHVDAESADEAEVWDAVERVDEEALASGVEERDGEEGVRRRRGEGERARRKGTKGTNRAVVVVHGLTPGVQHEIELRVMGVATDGDVVVSNTVLVPPSPSPSSLHPRSRANSLRSRSRPRSRSNSLTAPAAHFHPVHPPSPLGEPHPHGHHGLGPAPLAAVPTNILSPSDTQTAQVRIALSAAAAEKEHLAARIKESRKNAQRAEAALRAEIEAAKRAADKAGSMDLRAKQKALALHEQVKQALAGAEAADKEAAEVEAVIPGLERGVKIVSDEVEGVRKEWKAVKEREEAVRDEDRRARGEEEKRLAEAVAKLDKARARRDKREAERAELARRLEDLERERDEAERRGEEERTRRASALYARWDDEYASAGHGAGAGGGAGRTLSAHPSLTNLNGSTGNQGAGAFYRGRGYRFNGRHASQPSPTHGSGFYHPTHPHPHPHGTHAHTHPHAPTHAHSLPAPSASPSPAFRPPAPAPAPGAGRTSPIPQTRVPGPNPAAQPFLPSTHSTSPLQTHAAAQPDHTALMPPSMQHRIYLPVRPRPVPTFQPPPSVVAEKAAAQESASVADGAAPSSSHSTSPATSPGFSPANAGFSPTAAAFAVASPPPTFSAPTFQPPPPHAAPAFPPLPGQSGSVPQAQANGPSLASIVTRAVLSPAGMAHALGRGPASPVSPGLARDREREPSGKGEAHVRDSTRENIGLGSAASPPAYAGATPPALAGRVMFAPPPDKEHPSLAPGGPWARGAWGAGAATSAMVPPERRASADERS